MLIRFRTTARVISGTTRPARSPSSDWKTMATTSDVRIAAISVQPASMTAVALNPASSTSCSKSCHQRWPSTRFCARSASMLATSARRMRDSSSVGTFTYCAMRLRTERWRASTAMKRAKTSSASTETITKTIRYGETITLSTQLRSNVPDGVRSRFGVVYCAVAVGNWPAFAVTTTGVFAGMIDR